MFVGKNILFLYSGLQQKLFMQQSIVVIKQFIDEIREIQQGKKETNFFILATTDLAKIFFDDDVVIIQDKITRSSILSAVKKYKIDAIISIIGDKSNDAILNNKTFLDKKGLNVFYKEFYLANRSKRHFEDIAKQSGFYLDNGKIDITLNGLYYKLVIKGDNPSTRVGGSIDPVVEDLSGYISTSVHGISSGGGNIILKSTELNIYIDVD